MLSNKLKVKNIFLVLLVTAISLPVMGHAKLKCSSQKVLEEAYRANDRFWSPSDVKKIKYTSKNGREYFSPPYNQKAMFWPKSLWVAGEKLYPVFINDKGDFQGADVFEAKIDITDRSIYGTKYTLCLIAIPPMVVYASFANRYAAENCGISPDRGQPFCSAHGDWLLNKNDIRPKAKDSGYLPAGYVIDQRSIQFDGTWTMSPQSRSLYLTTEVAVKLKPKLQAFKKQSNTNMPKIVQSLDHRRWYTVPVLIISNERYGKISDRAALIVSKSSIDGSVKWERR